MSEKNHIFTSNDEPTALATDSEKHIPTLTGEQAQIFLERAAKAEEEAKKRMPTTVGLASMQFDSQEEELDQITRLQKEISRLENENTIMKKRLKKLLNIND